MHGNKDLSLMVKNAGRALAVATKQYAPMSSREASIISPN
jgi:hypothetical protein